MSSNDNLYFRAEGLAVGKLFQMGFNDITKVMLKSRMIIRATCKRFDEVKDIVVYAFFSRSFKTKEAVIKHVVVNKSPRLEEYNDNIEFWIIDKGEHIYRLNKSDFQPHLDVITNNCDNIDSGDTLKYDKMLKDSKVTINVLGTDTPSEELLKAIRSYIKLKRSFDELDPEKYQEYVMSGNYRKFITMLNLKLEHIKRLAKLEHIGLSIVED